MGKFTGRSISQLTAISTPKESLEIKELYGNDFLGGFSFEQSILYYRLKTDGRLDKEEVEKRKKALLKSFDPESPLQVEIIHPGKNRLSFPIPPYQHKLLEWLELRYYPAGYVAWQLARKYVQQAGAGGLSKQVAESHYLACFELINNRLIRAYMEVNPLMKP